MTKTIEFREYDEWTMDEAILQSMREASMQAEIEADERRLKWCYEMIENQEAREQASKRSMEELARQAKILDRGGNPAEYVDDDYCDDDECCQDDECYPDDE